MYSKACLNANHIRATDAIANMLKCMKKPYRICAYKNLKRKLILSKLLNFLLKDDETLYATLLL